MSKAISTDAIMGAREIIARARRMLAEALVAKGPGQAVGFPDTAYFLPIIYSMTGHKVQTLADLEAVLGRCEQLLPDPPAEQVWLPYLGNTLDAGMATLFAFEVIEAIKTVTGPQPASGIWLGAANDVIMRERGVEFVDGTAPGFAAVVGAAPDAATAVRIARQLQEKNLYVFMAGGVNGASFAEQLHSQGVQLGWETRLVPFGRDMSAVAYALGFANRAALSFGGVAPGDFERNLRYNKNRIFAFVLALGEVDPEKYAAAAGAINYGFPTIADTDIPQILPTGVCTYEHVVSNVPIDSIVERALEVRGCKIKLANVPIPVSYGPAFEGERIRKNEVHAEFGGNLSTAFEFATMVEMDAIEDGAIEVIGPEIDQVPAGTVLPLAIWVEVAGRKMQPDFEPILERQIHHLVNGAEGIWHMGQRDIVWTRISKQAYARGFRLRHYGEILHAKMLHDYPAIVDKVKVTLVTDPEEVERRVAVARRVYVERNRRLESMTDESVDTFYSCLLCQSFAPNHVCIITPERLGLCGAYNWLDGKAAYEIDETGPNQPVLKGACLDADRGIFEGINEYVRKASHNAFECFATYSIMDRPMTSCGCFEAIIAYVPECNGVMIVNREFTGDTPVGMPFSTLAGSVGGGMQTPGFMGIGKAYLGSRKFLKADGGIQRVVWMPAALKQAIGADFAKAAEAQGCRGILDKIADETIATDPQAIREYMVKVEHPALALPDMTTVAASQATGTSAKPPASPVPQSLAKPAERHAAEPQPSPSPAAASPAPPPPAAAPSDLKRQIKEALREIVAEMIASLRDGNGQGAKSGDWAAAMIDTLLAGGSTAVRETTAGGGVSVEAKPAANAAVPSRYAAEKLAEVTAFEIPQERAGDTIECVTLGATAAEGGTRGRTVTAGGQNCMPFHFFEGVIPHPPVLAVEVFDVVSSRCPPILRNVWGSLLDRPVEMAVKAVKEYGAELISIRLEGTHPEKGNKGPDEALGLVKDVLAAVDVPIIVNGHNHFASANEVMKKIAAGCAGERLLLKWVESENYRTIAGVALAYGHCVVAQSPIDVNMSKQLNILLTNMDLPRDRIIMDPLSASVGYGLEYSYSVMERIRLTALGGDSALAFPMIVSAGQEALKAKEANAPQSDFPAWGEGESRAILWEVQTAMPLILAGADVVILYHPESLALIRRNLARLAAHNRPA
jgi:acetyl-CoA synthase